RCALTTSGRCGSSPLLILSFLIRMAGTTLGLGGGLGSSLTGGGAPITPPGTPPSTPPSTPSELPMSSFSGGSGSVLGWMNFGTSVGCTVGLGTFGGVTCFLAALGGGGG